MPRRRHDSQRECPNCGAKRRGRYCAECGQDNAHSRLQSRAVLLDALANFVNWDGALMCTLRGLVGRPGRVAREYVAGKRRRYVAPAKLCLITLAVWLLAMRWAGVDALAASGFRLDSGASGIGVEQVAERIRTFFATYLDVLLYLALPLRAWLLKRVFRRTDDSFAECFVLAAYVASFGYVLGILLVPLSVLEPRGATFARQVLTMAWSVWAAREFFATSWLSAALRVSALHTLGTALLFGVLTLPFIL